VTDTTFVLLFSIAAASIAASTACISSPDHPWRNRMNDQPFTDRNLDLTWVEKRLLGVQSLDLSWSRVGFTSINAPVLTAKKVAYQVNSSQASSESVIGEVQRPPQGPSLRGNVSVASARETLLSMVNGNVVLQWQLWGRAYYYD
jgi:hypothetical protein